MQKFKEIITQYVDVLDKTYRDSSGDTQPIQPLDIYLVPNEDLSHDRYVVDNNGVVSKQSNGSQANYLRASGTNPDQELAGSFRTRAVSFYAHQNGYPYESQFMLSPGNIELSSKVIADYPTNRILVKEDGVRFTTKNLIFDSIPNAQRDAGYTRQLVQKEDGTVGYNFIGNHPNYSKVDIVLPENTIHYDSYMNFKQDIHVLAVKFRFRFKQGRLAINTPILTMNDPNFDAQFRELYWITSGVFDMHVDLIGGTVNQSLYRDVSPVKIAFDGYNFKIAQSVEITVDGLYSGMLVLPYNLLRTPS